jgi:hypothetical protein
VYSNLLDSDRYKIAKAVSEGKLGTAANFVTRQPSSRATYIGDEKSHVICIYTKDFTNKEDVKRVFNMLREIGLKGKLHYKADIFTHLNLYSGNEFGIDVVMYSAAEEEKEMV